MFGDEGPHEADGFVVLESGESATPQSEGFHGASAIEMLDDLFAICFLFHELLCDLEGLWRDVWCAEALCFADHAGEECRRNRRIDDGCIKLSEEIETDFRNACCGEVDDIDGAEMLVFWAVVNDNGRNFEKKVGVGCGKGTNAGTIFCANDDNEVVAIVVVLNFHVGRLPDSSFWGDRNDEFVVDDGVRKFVDFGDV